MPPTNEFEDAARRLGLNLSVVSLPQPFLRELYEVPLALVRPDQIVAWRGRTAGDALAILSRATGR